MPETKTNTPVEVNAETQTVAKSKMPLWGWYLLALVPVLLASPNGTLVKVVSGQIDPIWINVLRFVVVVPLMLPIVLRAIPLMTRQNLKYAVLQGLFYAIAITSFVFSISLGQASYTAVINLGIPIMLILYSIWLTRERVSHKAVVGISIAALGAFTVSGLPLLLEQGVVSNFNPLATLFALINIAVFPLAIVSSRKATDYGLPLSATFGVAISVTLIITSVVALIKTGGTLPIDALAANPLFLIASMLYMGIGVALISRMITVSVYKHLGSAMTGGLYYIEGLMAIMLPIIVIGEQMTLEMLIGGVLILLGVAVAEARQQAKSSSDDRDTAGQHHV